MPKRKENKSSPPFGQPLQRGIAKDNMREISKE